MNIDWNSFNPTGLEIKHKDIKPTNGSKVKILGYDSFLRDEMLDIVRKHNEELTILDSFPIITGSDGDYKQQYTIHTVEYPNVQVLAWDYKVL